MIAPEELVMKPHQLDSARKNPSPVPGSKTNLLQEQTPAPKVKRPGFREYGAK